jgi:hypothetical protein
MDLRGTAEVSRRFKGIFLEIINQFLPPVTLAPRNAIPNSFILMLCPSVEAKLSGRPQG